MKKFKATKYIGFTLGIALSIFAVSSVIHANWTAPLHSPPTCPSGEPGCDPPVHVGTSSQVKVGHFGVGGVFQANSETHLAVGGGNVGIGDTTPDSKLDVEGGDIRISTAGKGLIFPDGSKQTTARTAGGGSGWIDDGTNIRLATIGDRVGIGTTSPIAKLHVKTGTTSESQGFEGTTFPPSGWTTGGNANWIRDRANRREGSASAASGSITHNRLTFLDRDVTFSKPGEVRFYWKVSSEANYDFLLFCLNNDGCTRTRGYNQRISGEVGWREVVVRVPAGTHSFRWVYVKDGSVSRGADRGWVDNVRFIQGEVERGLIVESGNVGIGTTAPTQRLDVRGNTIANVYFHHSDKALKTEITPLENSLAKILGLKPVSFKWREDNEPALGLIAQDVEKIFPEIVHTEKESNLKSVNYSALIAPLIQAIREQQKQINELKTEIKDLKLSIEQ